MREKLRSRLTFANLMSVIAVFIALGGTALGGKFKLPANSVKSKQIAPDAATGADIAESTLAPVPSASSATKAGSASQADSANHAANADHATDSDKLNGYATYQRGVGLDKARGTYLNNGDSVSYSIGSGDLTFHCNLGGADTIDYGDTPGDPLDTEIWHPNDDFVADGGTKSPLFSGDNTSFRAQFYGGQGLIDDVVVNIADLANVCLVAFQSQTDPDS